MKSPLVPSRESLRRESNAALLLNNL
jgi:hypothetical protein